MPRVPTYDAPTVQAQGLPGARVESSVNADTFGAGGARQMQELGQAGQRLGGGLMEMQLRLAEQADQVRVNAAMNQVREASLNLTFGDQGYTKVRAGDAFNNADGSPREKPMPDDYADKLKATISSVSQTLGTPNQQRLFGMQSSDALTSFHGDAMRHTASEYRVYDASIGAGTAKLAADAVGLSPVAVDPQANTATQRNLTQLLGGIRQANPDKSATWLEAKYRNQAGRALGTTLANAVEKGDISGAQAFLKQWGSHMEADSLIKSSALIDAKMGQLTAMTVSREEVAKLAPQVISNDWTRILNITAQSESRGRETDASGGILTSPKGAKGSMQVLDGTNKDPGFGVKPAQDDSLAERKRVGQDYLKAMVTRYDGNLSKAWAAYNWGPGNLDREIQDATKRGTPDAWMGNMPKETRDYVAKNMKAYGANGGVAPMPTLLEVQQNVLARVQGQRPEVQQAAIAAAGQQFEALVKAKTQKEEEAYANGLRWVYQNGGRASEMPVSLMSTIPPEKKAELFSVGGKIAKGDDTTNPALYLQLSDRARLTSYSDNQFYALKSQLSEGDFQYFAKERDKVKNGPVGSGPGDLNSQAIGESLNVRLRELKIDPTPKSDGKDDDARIGGIRKFVDQYFIAAQRETGKKFTDAEVNQHLDALFAQNTQLKGWLGSYGAPVLSTKIGDIPSADKKSIKEAYARLGTSDPTDAQILSGFYALNFQRKKK